MSGIRTLERTLQSYCDAGLIGASTERFIFFQKHQPGTALAKWREDISRWYGFEVMTDPGNVAYISFDRMAKKCTSDYIMFLEEDFLLVEPLQVVRQQLDNAIRLLSSGIDAVRMRHRWKFGSPYYSYNKKHMVQSQVFAMVSKMEDPEKGYGYRQSGSKLFIGDFLTKCVEEPATYCSNSTHVRFTTNPALYRTSWFRDVLGPRMYRPYLELEPSIKDWSVWKSGRYKLACSLGLFQHNRMDRSTSQADIDWWNQ
eukprot:gene19555-23386_t